MANKKKSVYPTHAIEVEHRQGIDDDIFGMGDFFSPETEETKRVRRRARLRRKSLDIVGDQRRKIKQIQKSAHRAAAKTLKGKVKDSVLKSVHRKIDKLSRDRIITGRIPTAYVAQPTMPQPQKKYYPAPDAAQSFFDILPATQANYQKTGLKDPIQKPRIHKMADGQEYLEFDSVPGAETAFDKTMMQVVDDLPAPTFKENEVPADQLDAQAWAEPRLVNELDLIPPPGYNYTGDPKGVQPIVEGPTPLARKIYDEHVPNMLIKTEEIGFPYKPGSAGRYEGDATDPMSHDPSVVAAKPWQEAGGAGLPINPFSDISKESREQARFDGVIPDETNLGLWPGEGIPLIGDLTKNSAHGLNDEIATLEMHLADLDPSLLSAVRAKLYGQRQKIDDLFKQISESPGQEYTNSAAWFAAAKLYRDKLEDEIKDAERNATRKRDASEGVVSPTAPGAMAAKKAMGVGLPIAVVASLGALWFLAYKK